jgi:hypothetical protein
LTVHTTADPDAGQKSVSPQQKAYRFLPSDRLINTQQERVNIRINNNGKRILGKFIRDNRQIIFSEYGLRVMIRHGLVRFEMVKNRRGKRQKVIQIPDRGKLVAFVAHKWERLFDKYIEAYDPLVLQLYSDLRKIRPRSPFYSNKYYNKMAQYGINWNKKLPNLIVNMIKAHLDENFFEVFTRDAFDFDLDTCFEDLKWTAHIKTGSNSGHPFSLAQDKGWMAKTVAPMTLRILKKYKKDPKSINWKKLLFEMGSRQERDFSMRMIFMACAFEKPVGAKINQLLDENIDKIPLPLPRKFGSIGEMFKAFKSSKGKYFARDWDGFDTRMIRIIFEILRDFFRSLGNTFGLLMAFEIDLILNAYVLVAENLLFKIEALPSGIGITQFIGSMIHQILDMIVEIIYYIVTYQSDDMLGKIDLEQDELEKKNIELMELTGMKMSPFGKKSTYHESIGLVLQKVFNDDWNTWHGHEQRLWTNRYYRERKMNADEDLADFLGLRTANKKDKGTLLKIQGARSLLGNFAALGPNAPTLPHVLYGTWGKKGSFFDEHEMRTAMNSLEEWQESEYKTETDNAWLEGFMEEAIATYGWDKPAYKRSIQPKKIDETLSSFGRVIAFK